MGFGRGLLLWLIGIPLPIIILLALSLNVRHAGRCNRCMRSLPQRTRPLGPTHLSRSTTSELFLCPAALHCIFFSI